MLLLSTFSQMAHQKQEDPVCSDFEQVDPTGRYGRYNEILDIGCSNNTVERFKAFDEYEGIEVAWNQINLNDFPQKSTKQLERLCSEIHLLQTLNHNNIMKFYTSWVDTSKNNINFVTELFTSGTLRQYRLKHRKVNIGAVKDWCRQILKGLVYLHSYNPPIIHKDLNCDNIFINGNQGVVKIGNLGLSMILQKFHASQCVGMQEFMAPEMYGERYNELVDIYSFGLCILELVTFDYPYTKCTHPSQVYKQGLKPKALQKVKDPEVRRFVEKCLAPASHRLSAKKLLKDPFILIEDKEVSKELRLLTEQLILSTSNSNSQLMLNSCPNDISSELQENELDYLHDGIRADLHELEILTSPKDEIFRNVDITIKGRNEDGQILLMLRISDKEGRVRNIHFPFDIESDTALSVATEMVGELGITDYDVKNIANVIDGEIPSVVPDWMPGLSSIVETGTTDSVLAPLHESNCSSSCNSPAKNNLSVKNSSHNNIPSSQFPKFQRSASTHGRFEEVTYKVEGLSHNRSKSFSIKSVGPPTPSWVPDSGIYDRCLDTIGLGYQQPPPELPDDYQNEIRQELRCLKEKYQMEAQDHDHRDMWQQLDGVKRPSSPTCESGCSCSSSSSNSLVRRHHSNDELMKLIHFGMWFSCHLPLDNNEEPSTSKYR